MRRSIPLAPFLVALFPVLSVPALGSTSAAPPTEDDPPAVQPLTLEWARASGGWKIWSGSDFDEFDAKFVHVRVQGPADHQGIWWCLVGQVVLADSFYNDMFIPLQWKDAGLRQQSGYDIADGGWADPGEFPNAIVPGEHFEAVAARIWEELAPEAGAVSKLCLPLLNPGALSTTKRKWNMDYSHWSNGEKGYWSRLRVPQDSTTLVLEAWMKRRITEQVGGRFTGEEFFAAIGGPAAVHGLHIDFQALMFWGDQRDWENYPQDDSGQEATPGIVGGYMASGTTTPIRYVFLGTSGATKGYDPYITIDPNVQMSMIRGDDEFHFDMCSVIEPAFAVCTVNGQPSLRPIYLGDDELDVFITAPGGLQTGDRVFIKRFITAGVQGSVIPPAHQDNFFWIE